MSEALSIHRENAQISRGSAALRWSGLIGGGAIAALGLSRRSKAGTAIAATGGLLALLGARAGARKKEYIARSSILVNCSPSEAYQFWRKFENLPQFMRHIESVNIIDQNRSEWQAIGPLGKRIHWTAEIVRDKENEVIAWNSLPESDISVDGIVKFSPAAGNRGTVITAIVVYTPPAGAAGRALAKLLGKDPSFLMRQDLRRLKALIETGEIPTTDGQSHGPRSRLTAAARVIDPDQPVRDRSQIPQMMEMQRRVS